MNKKELWVWRGACAVRRLSAAVASDGSQRGFLIHACHEGRAGLTHGWAVCDSLC